MCYIKCTIESSSIRGPIALTGARPSGLFLLCYYLAMNDQERKARLLAELKNAGGERVLAHLRQHERETWDEQALVLSFIREDGDAASAANRAGVPVGVESTWYDEDTLGYVKRRAHALEERGWALFANLFKKAEKGEITSPAILKMLMEATLPTLFSGAPSENTGKKLLEALREQNEKWDSALEAGIEAGMEILKAEKMVQGEPEEEPPKPIDLLSRRSQ